MWERGKYPQDCPRKVRSRRNRCGNTELACSPKYHGAKTAYWAIGRESGSNGANGGVLKSVPHRPSPGKQSLIPETVTSPVRRLIDQWVVNRPSGPGHSCRALESTRILSSAGGGNRKVHNTGVRRGRPRSAGGNYHDVFSTARRCPGRNGQVHPDGSGLPRAERQFFRFHLAHELMRVRYCYVEC